MTAIDAISRKVTVQAENGQEWELDQIHIDTGWQFQISGKLFAENTPKAPCLLNRSAIGSFQSRFAQLGKGVDWRFPRKNLFEKTFQLATTTFRARLPNGLQFLQIYIHGVD